MDKLCRDDERVDADISASARILRAEAAIAGLRASFADWVKADLESIDAHMAAARIGIANDDIARPLEAVRRIAHNIKGQGGTFGCHALSAAAEALDTFLKKRAAGADLPIAEDLVAKLSSAYSSELA
jgi:HPt (histidine-containing phosphotransfer) domain-containing protein